MNLYGLVFRDLHERICLSEGIPHRLAWVYSPLEELGHILKEGGYGKIRSRVPSLLLQTEAMLSDTASDRFYDDRSKSIRGSRIGIVDDNLWLKIIVVCPFG